MKKIIICVILLMAIFPANNWAQGENQEEMMKAWLESTKPVAEHKLLAAMKGEWKSVNKMWMMPGQPPEKTEGYAQNTLIMDGRYLQQTVKGTSMGMPIEGASTMAFDRAQGKYIVTWIDNFGTGLMIFEGTKTGENEITLFADYFDPMTNETQKHKEILTIGENTYTMTLWSEGKTGDWTQAMEIVYKRVK